MAGPRHCGARRQTQIADRQHPARRCTESNAVGRNPVQGRRTSPASAEGDPGKGIATKRHINFFHNSFLCNKDATFSFLDKVFGTAHSPPRRGGESATSKTKGSVPICRGRGGQFGTPSKASRTDHYYGFALLRSRFAPVCAAFVDSRHFLDGAATFEASPYRARAPRPPLRGGEYDANGNIIGIWLRRSRAVPFVFRSLTRASVRDHLNEQAVRVGNMQAGPVAAVNRRRAARPQIRDYAVLVESLDPDGEMVEAGLGALPDRKMPGLANRELHEVRLPLTLARQVEHTGIEIDGPLQIAACDRDVIDGRRLQASLRGGRTPARHAERGKRANEFASRQRTLIVLSEQAIDKPFHRILPLLGNRFTRNQSYANPSLPEAICTSNSCKYVCLFQC